MDQRTNVQVERGYLRLRTDGRTNGRTDGQPENILHPAPKGGGITMNVAGITGYGLLAIHTSILVLTTLFAFVGSDKECNNGSIILPRLRRCLFYPALIFIKHHFKYYSYGTFSIRWYIPVPPLQVIKMVSTRLFRINESNIGERCHSAKWIPSTPLWTTWIHNQACHTRCESAL